MRSTRFLVMTTLMALVIVCALAGVSGYGQAEKEYYPLAVGNIWTYRVRVKGRDHASSIVKWRVTRADHSADGTIYQVWPTPSESDDEAMELLISPYGIQERSSHVMILNFPLTSGKEWSKSGKTAGRRFRILSVAQPCRIERYTSKDCLVVEDVDEAVHLRTVTTYARGIGPVKYEYYRLKPGRNMPEQTVDLLSYHVARTGAVGDVPDAPSW